MRTPLAAVLATVVACSHPASPSAPVAPPPATATPAADSGAAPAASAAAPASTDRGWIERSNQHAQLLLGVQAQFQPEAAARIGIPGLDDRISDFAPGHAERQREATRKVIAQLTALRAQERDPRVVQDLQILIDAAALQIRGSELRERLVVPYYNVPRLVFGSLRALLDPQIAEARRPAALVRLKRYLGLEGGQAPIVQLAMAEARDALRRGLVAPSRIEVENDLETAAPILDGIPKLFAEMHIAGAEPALAELRTQLTAYLAFVRSDVLPKARADFRLPPELYAFSLVQFGVDVAPDELARRAHKAFDEIQAAMQTTAQKLARERGWRETDYRQVIARLKKDQIPDDQVLALYQRRLAEVEAIIRTNRLLTLPDRPSRIRLGTPAENAQQPAPHMVPPRLIGNTGEQGEFVLPLAVPGKTQQRYDDFNYDAAAWTLVAHESRPGHELQYARLVETGVSLARALFAFNSTNVEGWGLYAEAITLPYMPLEGQLISLQLRLQRAARAFLDPELQIPGKWTPEAARAFLQREVGLSAAFATEEIDRFTFRSPGQACSYFYGYTRMLELRALVEKQLGARFTPLAFHDAVLAQGILPPDLLRDVVLAALR